MDELAKRFAELADKYGPSVVDAARQAVRVEALSILASSLIPLALAIAFLWSAKRLKAWRKACDGNVHGPFITLLMCGALCAAIVCALIFVWIWIDPWTWTALTNPDLWLAKKILKF